MSTDNIKAKFLDAMEESRQNRADTQSLPSELFDELDTIQQEGYEWAQAVLNICGPLTGHRSDLVPYALAMIVDDYISHVLGFAGREWESVLDNDFGNHEEVWDQIWQIRREIAEKLLSKVGSEGVAMSLEKLTEREVEGEPGEVCNQLSFAQRADLRSFVSNGLM